MTDWRETGELIRDRGRRFLSAAANTILGRLMLHHRDFEMWIASMPVEWLIEGYDGCWPDFENPKNGRPLGEASRAAATLACAFCASWRKENQKLEIYDYGRRREMKDFAAEAVVSDIFAVQLSIPKLAGQFPNDVSLLLETVRQLMDKPQKRRDPGSGEFDYLIGPRGLIT